MTRQEEIREGIKDILYDDLVNHGITHENPPPYRDCGEECGVSLDDQIASANPVCSPCRSGGKKHKRCVDCWNEYFDGLIKRIQEKEHSQGVVLEVKRGIVNPYEHSWMPIEGEAYNRAIKDNNLVAVEPLIERMTK